MIDLRRLHVLRAVAHYGTVTAAAAAVHLTPSAASQQIRQLGRDLGVALLEPHGRRIRLTPAARSLLSHADAIETRWQHAEADLHATATTAPRGPLRLAGFPTAVATLLAPLAARLQRSYPQVEVHVQEAEPRDCFDLLFAGDADLTVVEATPDNPALTDPRFDQQPLLEDPFDLLTNTDHPLADQTLVQLADLATEAWILAMSGSSSRQHVLAACTSAGFAPAIAHQAREWTVVASLVARGLGIALVPRLAQLPPQLPVARTPLTGPVIPARQFLTVARAGSRQHPAIAAALSIIDDLSAEHNTNPASS
jgi:DNA-binding transcriptional LysR family regulator